MDLAGSQLTAQQESTEQREVVAQRLSRLRRLALEPGDGERDQHLPDVVWQAINRTIALSQDDPGRLAALQDTVGRLRPYGHTRMLAAALTSLIAAQIAAPGRDPSTTDELAGLAREAVAVSTEIFGLDNDVTLINKMNVLLIEQDRPDLTPEALTALAREYELLAANTAVHRTGHLVDVLINLAAATDRRTDLGRGYRQELMLRMFEDAEYIASLAQPDDQQTRLLCLVNQAAVLRQRIAGSRHRNIERAWALLDQAWVVERASTVLHPIERVQLAVNRLNAAYSLRLAGSTPVTTETLLAAAREVAAAAEAVHEGHETAITAMFAAGSVLLDLYAQAARDGRLDQPLIAEAQATAASASQRADRVYPPGHRVRLTARVNLAAAYGAPAGKRLCGRRPLRRTAAQRGGRSGDCSAEHAAIALTNLATLRSGQGRWAEAAQHYGQARRSRHAMIEQTGRTQHPARRSHRHRRPCRPRGTRVRHGRRTRSRCRRPGTDTGKPPATPARDHPGHAAPTTRPGRTIVHLAASNLGTVGIIRRAGSPPRRS